MVRIPGFHPGGPGSIPGVGSYIFFSTLFFFLLFTGSLSVLLLPCKEGADPEKGKTELQTLIQQQGLVGLGGISIVSVVKEKPITRKQYEEAASFWPTHFHEDKRFV